MTSLTHWRITTSWRRFKLWCLTWHMVLWFRFKWRFLGRRFVKVWLGVNGVTIVTWDEDSFATTLISKQTAVRIAANMTSQGRIELRHLDPACSDPYRSMPAVTMFPAWATATIVRQLGALDLDR